jgi:DNA-binding CsgD family transcriptional regulator
MPLPGETQASIPMKVGPLTPWGLSADADLVYRTLVTTGPQLRGALSRGLGMAPRRVSAALDELISVQAALTIPRPRSGPDGDARLWAAAPPDSVLHRLQRRHQAPDPWERVRRHAALTSRVGLPAWPGHSRTQPRILSDGERVRSRIAELMAAERHEHLTMSPEPAFDAATVRIAAPLDLALRARGVALRTLGVPAADGNAAAEHERHLARLGVRHRIADALPLKLMIFDHRIALLPLDPLDPTRGALEVDDPDVVRGLVAIFCEHWDTAQRPAVSGHLDVDLTPREWAIIELLAAGHSDSTTAMRTRTSLRTVRYTLRSLMDRLDVDNRFQLGLALGTRGVRPTHRPSSPPTDRETP